MKALLIALFCLCASAQDTVVTLAALDQSTHSASAKITSKKALVTFSVGNCTANAVGNCPVPVMIASRTGYLPASLQFDFMFGAADVSSVGFEVGAAAAAAGKTIQCALIPGGVRCAVSGGTSGIMDGPVALGTVQTVLSSTDASTVALLGLVVASQGGTAIQTAVAPGGGLVLMPPTLVSVVCSQPDIWEGLSVSCTVALNKPALADYPIGLTSDSALVTVPTTLTIPMGAVSAVFNAVGVVQ